MITNLIKADIAKRNGKTFLIASRERECGHDIILFNNGTLDISISCIITVQCQCDYEDNLYCKISECKNLYINSEEFSILINELIKYATKQSVYAIKGYITLPNKEIFELCKEYADSCEAIVSNNKMDNKYQVYLECYDLCVDK